MKRIITGTIFTILLLGGQAFATEIHLKNGDRLTGKIVQEAEDSVVLETQHLGTVRIPRSAIAHPEIEKEEQAKTWAGEVSLGYDASRGNTNSEKVYASGHIKKARKNIDEILLKGNIFYSTSQKKMDAQKWYTLGQYSYDIGPKKKSYIFGKIETDHDKFAGVDVRTLPAAGAGHWFLKREETKLLAELGLGWEYTNYNTSKSTTSEAVLLPRVYFEKTLLEKLKISEDFTYYQTLSEWEQFRYRSETAATVLLFERIAFRASLILEYNSDAPENRKKNDLQLISSLVYTF